MTSGRVAPTLGEETVERSLSRRLGQPIPERAQLARYAPADPASSATPTPPWFLDDS